MSAAHSFYENSSLGMMKCNLDMEILEVNKSFTDITGYQEDEVINQKTNLLSSGKQDSIFYKNMWSSINNSGTWSGEIWNRRKGGEIYPELLVINTVFSPDKSISGYIGVFLDISFIKSNGCELGYLAHHDPLTGLPNRFFLNTYLENAIDRVMRNNTGLSLLFIDLDQFKPINDSFGHHVGDKLLTKVSKRIISNLRDSDVVVRWGGDEYIVILESDEKIEDTSLVANKLISALEKPFIIDNHEIYISSSIGISRTEGFVKQKAEDMIQNADTAMYKAKKNGGNQYRFHNDLMIKLLKHQTYLKTELRKALRNNEFELHYQPKFNTKNEICSEVEALIRWHHPDLGTVPPNDFIPLAEETGLITSIGEWVIRMACQQAKIWLDEGSPMQIAVNVSAKQLSDINFCSDIKKVLEKTNLPPYLLEIELTESLLINNVSSNIKVLNELGEMGISIAIDDFGTGFSSLSYLTSFPVNKLKIDRAFVQKISSDKADRRLIKAIVSLAHSLSLSVVAEGIETVKQLNYLKFIGCDTVQGFLLAKPVPADDLDLKLPKFHPFIDLKNSQNSHLVSNC